MNVYNSRCNAVIVNIKRLFSMEVGVCVCVEEKNKKRGMLWITEQPSMF